jgi:membrane-associated phospholipid phosphatase
MGLLECILYTLPPDVLICFPSFHVIWAILFAQALWGFRYLRIPVALLAGLIIMSTLTTGWHYFVDVLAGILLASFAVLTAKMLNR